MKKAILAIINKSHIKSILKLTANRKESSHVGEKRTILLGNEGSRGEMQIGRKSYFGNSTFSSFHRSDFLKMGSFCSVADDVRFQMCPGNHDYRTVANYPVSSFYHKDIKDSAHKGKIFIGNDVWIGARAVVLPGVKIGNGSIIGAGSVVTRDVADFSIVMGNPATHVRWRFDSEKEREILQQIAWWNWNDDQIRERKEFFSVPLTEAISIAQKNNWILGSGIPPHYIDEITNFFKSNITKEDLEKKTRDFLNIGDTAKILGKYKTQSHENITVWIAALLELRPKCIVEFGTQTGCSSLVLARLCRFLGVKSKIVTINIVDELKHRDRDVEYVINDFTGNIGQVWKRWNPDIIFQDAHMYYLIKEILDESEKKHRNTMHFFHDVGHRLFKNPMSIPYEAIPTSATGSWERHVLALYDDKILKQDVRSINNSKVKVHIFDGCADSQEFGLGVLRFS